MKAPTIYDVARKAGVSHQTVTRYLHGFEGIRPETRLRVEAALEELEYRPNSAARFLRNQRINRIGVLAHGLDEPGPARIIKGATAAARRRGYVLDIVSMDGDDPDSIDAALSLVTEHQIAGVLATAQTDAVLATLESRAVDVPLVIDVRMKSEGDDISINERSGRLAARHLLDLGHRNIGYLSGPSSWFAAQARVNGFEHEVVSAGGHIAWTRIGDWSAGSGARAWEDLTDSEREVTAIGVANDIMAIGTISAIVRSGLSVPGDISVIGTDDIPEARYLLPSLSTVALSFEAEGEFVVDTLLTRIGEDREPSITVPAPLLQARESTRPL